MERKCKYCDDNIDQKKILLNFAQGVVKNSIDVW